MATTPDPRQQPFGADRIEQAKPAMTRDDAEGVIFRHCLAEPGLLDLVFQVYGPHHFATATGRALMSRVFELHRTPGGLTPDRLAAELNSPPAEAAEYRRAAAAVRAEPNRTGEFLSALAHLSHYAQGVIDPPALMPWAVYGFPVPAYQREQPAARYRRIVTTAHPMAMATSLAGGSKWFVREPTGAGAGWRAVGPIRGTEDEAWAAAALAVLFPDEEAGQ